ncbi:MAG: FtsX-like permease family protein [Candidatus Bathyarchaeia archaeon]
MTVNPVSVSERRRDFATLDALGAPISYIFRIVIFEAAIIGVLGGIFWDNATNIWQLKTTMAITTNTTSYQNTHQPH